MDDEMALKDEGAEGSPPSGNISADSDTVSTMMTPPSGDDKSDADKSAADGKGKDADDKAKGSEDDKAGGDDRLDKNPRFVELNNRMKAAETLTAQAEARAVNLSNEITSLKMSRSASETDEKLPYKDTTKMTDEELRDWIDTDPRAYSDNLLSIIRHELRGEVSTDLETDRMERQVESTFNSFAKDNPEFDKMWDSGSLKQFMDSNPGHNAISAFMVLTQETNIKTAVEEAVTAAVEAREKEIQKDLATKRSSQVLGAGPGGEGRPGMDEDVDLTDTKSGGGLVSTLTKRSLARTASA